jgi:hypothetical protein
MTKTECLRAYAKEHKLRLDYQLRHVAVDHQNYILIPDAEGMERDPERVDYPEFYVYECNITGKRGWLDHLRRKRWWNYAIEEEFMRCVRYVEKRTGMKMDDEYLTQY